MSFKYEEQNINSFKINIEECNYKLKKEIFEMQKCIEQYEKRLEEIEMENEFLKSKLSQLIENEDNNV